MTFTDLTKNDSTRAIVAGSPATRRGRKKKETALKERGVISHADRKRKSVRIWLWIINTVALIGLIFAGLGPLVWSARASVAPTQDIISSPMSIFTSSFEWQNLTAAWNGAAIGRSMLNTVIVAAGATAMTLIVSILAAYLLSVMRPKWGPILGGAILATLFLPGVISLVPMYLTILDVPGFHFSLLNTFWAVWLPAGANAFNVVVLRRFFDSIPREILEAAKIDGAGPLRVLTTIIMPLSTPIIGVVALLSLIGSWKDFLWPMLALPKQELQPVSVVLPTLANGTAPLSVQMAAVFLTLLIPVVLFLIFQKQFLRGVGTAGGLKG